MWNRESYRRGCAAAALITAWGCSDGARNTDGEAQNRSPQYVQAAQRAAAGIVAPLADDTGDDIRSWVDGTTVADWNAEVTRRDRAIQAYLEDSDASRAQKYGFREGHHPSLAWSWFRDNPVGFNGVPFVLFKTILDLNPDHENPTLRTIARLWKREAPLPMGSTPAETRWTLDHIGMGPNSNDYVDGTARPPSERRSPLPFGFAFENPREFEPLPAAETSVLDGRLLARRVFQNTSLLIAKARTTAHEDNWERDRPGFGSPGSMDRVFFSCAACHVGRVVVEARSSSCRACRTPRSKRSTFQSC